MRRRKKVTEKTIAVNRRNAARSTGPRTERGKNTSRFNAVIHGLFAESIIIPGLDGPFASLKFEELLSGLRDEYRPAGLFEDWLVGLVAEGLWRFRRAAIAENGSARTAAMWNTPKLVVEVTGKARPLLAIWKKVLGTLTKAREEFEGSGTLCNATYETVVPLIKAHLDPPRGVSETVPTERAPAENGPEVRQEESKTASDEKTSAAAEVSKNPPIDEEFLNAIKTEESRLFVEILQTQRTLNDSEEARKAQSLVPPAGEVDRILRYEARIQREIDWALRLLWVCQKRRKRHAARP